MKAFVLLIVGVGDPDDVRESGFRAMSPFITEEVPGHLWDARIVFPADEGEVIDLLNPGESHG